MNTVHEKHQKGWNLIVVVCLSEFVNQQPQQFTRSVEFYVKWNDEHL